MEILPLKPKKLVTCAHHGDYCRENNIPAAKIILSKNPEIGIMEIDFIYDGGDFISAHDHNPEKLLQGQTLQEWIKFICVEKRLILYIDLKVNVDFSYVINCGKVTTELNSGKLYEILNEQRRYYIKKGIDIAKYIWLACQDHTILLELDQLSNDKLWTVIADVPYTTYYILQYITPRCVMHLLENRIKSDYRNHLSQKSIVSIDNSFFTSFDSLLHFIELSGIKQGSTLIIYSFERSQEPLKIKGYRVIMLYNYRNL